MSETCAIRVRTIDSLEDIAASQWNALTEGDPFLRHEFLAALEHSGCVGPNTAWQPCHVVASRPSGELVGALPLYAKYDSRGEFVFDWSWADAFERAGRAYYPKLVSAIPFTPATGPRLLSATGADRSAITSMLLGRVTRLAEELNASSVHVLFPNESDCSALGEAGYLARKGCQFHWTNRDYSSFDDFLSTFTSSKRKKVRRERRRIGEAQIQFEHLSAAQPSPSDWDAIYEFYSRTFLRRGRPPYLTREFFEEISATMPENLVIILARFEKQPIASAICFRGSDTLYGRYWGSLADFHSLHFEACYYQGIEYCIAEGLQTFEPGTQGEHKISRGFSPTATWSYHWLAQRDFHAAVEDFLERETQYVDHYIDELSTHVPYRRHDR